MNPRDVFINVPFDAKYLPLRRAILFAVLDCGFVPRSALEVVDSGEVRVQKILRIIGESQYGIHDISRVELDRKTKLPRFNMPLELGFFLGAKAFGSDIQQTKRCLILDREPHRYQSFCSDIAGQDIHAHGARPARAIEVVRNWLATSAVSEDVLIPSGSVIAQRHRRFREALPTLCAKRLLEPRRLTFSDEAVLVASWLDDNPWRVGQP